MSDLIERLRDLAMIYPHSAEREVADEIERLRERCIPSKTVTIGDRVHYVSEPVFDELMRLRRELAEAKDLLPNVYIPVGVDELCKRIDAFLAESTNSPEVSSGLVDTPDQPTASEKC